MWGKKRKHDLRDRMFEPREPAAEPEAKVEAPEPLVTADAPVEAAVPEIVEAPPKRGLIWSEGVQLRWGAILVTFLIGVTVIFLSMVAVTAVGLFVRLPEPAGMIWAGLYYGHAAQFLVTLIFMVMLRPFIPRADYGLHRPRGKSYVGAAILWGVLFGVIMAAVDYAPQILTQTPPNDMPLTQANVIGWLSFEGLFSGFSEEPLFRGLLVTYLASRIPGRIGFGRYDLNAGGVIVAALFALAHIGNFWIDPFLSALGQQLYAFALGVLYAYWFERSRSLLAPIVGHNMSNLVEYILIFAMVYAWR